MGIDQNVGICLKTKESIRILKFEDKTGIDQNVEIWVLIVKIYQNVDIWDILWTASSSDCPIGYCIVYLLKSTLKN